MSAAAGEPQDLEELLDRIARAEDAAEEVSIGDVVAELGHRPFGTLLLVAGLVTVAPLVGDVPGVPTIMAALVLLTAAQLLLRRQHLWLPELLLRRSVARDKLETAAKKMRKPARAIDRVLRPRLRGLARPPGVYGIAVACLLVGLAMPPMELIPFSANLAGATLTGYGLALIAQDGLFALVGHLLTAGIVGILVWQL